MKVSVKEEPAWKRVLDIEVETKVVDQELDKVVEEYRRRLVLPGFRKGKVPPEMARKHLGEDLEGEVLRRIIPQAVEDALREKDLKVIGEPRVTDLKFTPGQPLSFQATVEVMPQVEVEGYEGLKLTREQPEIKDEDLNRALDNLREGHADLEEVDRPAHGSDVVLIRYREIDPAGAGDPDEEPTEVSLELGSERTPEAFNEALMGSVVGDMKKVPLTYPPDYADEALAGTTKEFHVTVAKVQEKIWPALDDELAKKVLGTEGAGLEDLKSRIRLNMEMEARVHSMQHLENNLVSRLVELNPFDLPEGVVESTLGRVLKQAREENPNLPPDEEERLREQYRKQVEQHYRMDILMEAVGRQEGIEVTEADLDEQIEEYAKSGDQKPVQVKAKLKKEGSLERLRDDLFRRRVIDRLVEKADVTVVKDGQPVAEESA